MSVDKPLTSEPRDRPARPKSAASLILLRDGNAGLEVLLGRRGGSARFMPGQYVFPGGRIHPSDRRSWLGEPDLAGFELRPWLLALARTAMRETFEETGLLVGRRATVLQQQKIPHDRTLTPIEAAYQTEHLEPAVDRLMHIGRAITPAALPIRFHAHFFMAAGELAVGTLRACDELEDLRWHPVDIGRLPQLADVTRFMLSQAAATWRQGAASLIPLYRYVRGIPKVAWRGRGAVNAC